MYYGSNNNGTSAFKKKDDTIIRENVYSFFTDLFYNTPTQIQPQQQQQPTTRPRRKTFSELQQQYRKPPSLLSSFNRFIDDTLLFPFIENKTIIEGKFSFKKAFKKVKKVATKATSSATKAISAPTDTVISGISGVADTVGSGVSGVADTVVDKVEDSGITGAITDTTNLMVDTVNTANEAIVDTVNNATDALDDVANSITSLSGQATGAITSTAQQASGIIKNTGGQATGAITDASKMGTGAIINTTNQATGAVADTANRATGAVISTTNQATEAVANTANRATGAVMDVSKTATGVIEDTTKTATGAIMKTADTVADKANQVIDTAKNAIGDAISTLQDNIKSITDMLSGGGGDEGPADDPYQGVEDDDENEFVIRPFSIINTETAPVAPYDAKTDTYNLFGEDEEDDNNKKDTFTSYKDEEDPDDNNKEKTATVDSITKSLKVSDIQLYIRSLFVSAEMFLSSFMDNADTFLLFIITMFYKLLEKRKEYIKHDVPILHRNVYKLISLFFGVYVANNLFSSFINGQLMEPKMPSDSNDVNVPYVTSYIRLFYPILLFVFRYTPSLANIYYNAATTFNSFLGFMKFTSNPRLIWIIFLCISYYGCYYWSDLLISSLAKCLNYKQTYFHAYAYMAIFYSFIVYYINPLNSLFSFYPPFSGMHPFMAIAIMIIQLMIAFSLGNTIVIVFLLYILASALARGFFKNGLSLKAFNDVYEKLDEPTDEIEMECEHSSYLFLNLSTYQYIMYFVFKITDFIYPFIVLLGVLYLLCFGFLDYMTNIKSNTGKLYLCIIQTIIIVFIGCCIFFVHSSKKTTIDDIDLFPKTETTAFFANTMNIPIPATTPPPPPTVSFTQNPLAL